MATKVIRYQIADYIEIKGSSSSTTYALMGTGFNTLDESPNAQLDQKTYISDKSQSTTIKSYQPQFAFDTDLIADEQAVMELYNIGRDQKTGADAEREYIRVDLFDKTSDGKYPARKFKVAVEVTSFSGSGGEVVTASGNLNAIGDFVEGTFDTATKTFTAAS